MGRVDEEPTIRDGMSSWDTASGDERREGVGSSADDDGAPRMEKKVKERKGDAV